MSTRPVSDREIHAFRRFLTLLPRDKDPVLLVLKGHLLVEEQLRLLVDERVSKPEAVAKAQLECFHVICLAEAFCGDQAPSYLWDVLRKLNKLRNEIAHKIELPGLQDRIANITALVKQNSVFAEGGIGSIESDPMQEFDLALWVLFCHVSALVERPSAAVLELLPSEPPPSNPAVNRACEKSRAG
jgi:hypothetical protein